MASALIAISTYIDFQSATLTVGTSQVAFPAIDASKLNVLGIGSSAAVRIEKITVQAGTQNTGRVVIGKTGVLSDESNGGIAALTAGASSVLYVSDPTVLFAIATAVTQKLLVTYYCHRNS